MPVLVKLNQARKQFHEAKIEKTGHNKFAGYYYFELADFIVPALQIFDSVGLCSVTCFTATDAVMTVTDLEDNSSVAFTSPMSSAALKGCHDVQNLGAVQTYLRRYLWVAALEIVEHDAVDSSDGPTEQKKETKSRLPALSEKQGAEEYRKWMEVKSLLVDDDGNQIVERVNDEWFKLPSNVRTAIKEHGKSLKAAEELDKQASNHMSDIKKEGT